ncbi:MAG: FkbM family methyltransferase [Candidatus Sulfotelmatobacter sp.]
MLSDLIYDVGMNNGDDTAYYLSRGFRVLAIEANPVLVEQASRRFEREISVGALSILNVGVSAAGGSLPFWICDTYTEWSSFDESVASRNGADHHQITISCRTFQSILREFGIPYYLKVDIEGSDIYCLRDLIASDLPKYVSFEKSKRAVESLTLLDGLGYSGFKLISQRHYLPVEYPPVREQRSYARAHKFLQSKNLLLRAARKVGARNWLERRVNRTRSRPGWIFSPGSSGPFGEDLLGKWQSFNEITRTLAKANTAWSAKEPSVFWSDEGFSFWADFHAKR